MTRVLCTAIFEEGVPPFLKEEEQGWVTAEYDLLPGSTLPRHSRERSGKISGRTQEIQRIIGRSLRGSLDMKAFPGMTLRLDCDVIQADGGTRTAAVSGAWIAAMRAIREREQKGLISRPVLIRQIAAISVGKVAGKLLLDLNYQEDSHAEVDLNIAMDRVGKIIEIQGTAERDPFSEDELARMIALARRGMEMIFEIQQKAIRL
jgi:ribonuclease PH